MKLCSNSISVQFLLILVYIFPYIQPSMVNNLYKILRQENLIQEQEHISKSDNVRMTYNLPADLSTVSD